jgi:hypothetical protein
MTGFRRGVQFAILAVVAACLISSAAQAEKLDAKQWRFVAAFPCPSQIGSNVVKTEIGDIVMTTYQCGDDNRYFLVALNDYPAGMVTKDNIDNVYAGAVNGTVMETDGTIRSVAPFTLGNVTGREAFIDIPGQNIALRLRVFLVDDRLYTVTCGGKNGQETGKECLDFLNSFTLLPK